MIDQSSPQILRACLRRWVDENIKAQTTEWEWRCSHAVRINSRGQRRRIGQSKRMLQATRGVTHRMAQRARPYLADLLKDNSARTPEELQNIAGHLSPGGVHTGALLLQLILDELPDECCPRLVAAMIYWNWSGGKRGFQFLPDFLHSDPDWFRARAETLLETIGDGTNGDPRRLLTGDDRGFYDSLPDRVTVYRGCGGVSPEIAAMGVCWTTSREMAEWFADRSHGDPVVVTARIRKSDVVLVGASEHEVVCQPRRARAINCRKVGSRPAGWRAPAAAKPMQVAA